MDYSKPFYNKDQQMRTRLAYTIFILAIFATFQTAKAEGLTNDISCSAINTTLKSQDDRIDCVDKRTDAIVPLLNLSLERSLKANEDLKKEISRLLALIDGPKRIVSTRFPAVVIAKTVGYWAGGAYSHEFDCSPLPPVPPGQVPYGLEISGEFPTHPTFPFGSRGCVGENFCDSTGEFCRHKSRGAGCYVNKDWLDWYSARAEAWRIPVNAEIVCSN
jgi:hypothetical protein